MTRKDGGAPRDPPRARNDEVDTLPEAEDRPGTGDPTPTDPADDGGGGPTPA